jgi:hypothetical protein
LRQGLRDHSARFGKAERGKPAIMALKLEPIGFTKVGAGGTAIPAGYSA